MSNETVTMILDPNESAVNILSALHELKAWNMAILQDLPIEDQQAIITERTRAHYEDLKVLRYSPHVRPQLRKILMQIGDIGKNTLDRE